MPKLKTHKGAAKRFKKTGTGKVKRGHVETASHPDVQSNETQTEAAHGGLVSDGDIAKVIADDSVSVKHSRCQDCRFQIERAARLDFSI